MSPQRSREPIFRIPRTLVGLLALLALIQFIESRLGPMDQARLFALFAFTPGRLTYSFDAAGVAASLRGLSGAQREIALFFLGDGLPEPWTALTYAFLHGGWLHLIGNCVWLAAFGTPVARRLGPARFLALFCAASIGGALAQWVAQPFGLMPVVGASAGISGVMAAAVRFVFQPGGLDGDEARPALSLTATFRSGAALLFIVFWFGANFLFGAIAQPLGVASGPIAWQAHIGGFIVGLLFFTAFDPRQPQGGERAEHPEPSVDPT